MAQTWLTTVDNPYNPFVQFDEWFAFDEQKGYQTCEYIARIAKVSHELSEEEYEDVIEDAINEIISFNVLGIYQKVSNENFETMKDRPLTTENKEALDLLNKEDDQKD